MSSINTSWDTDGNTKATATSSTTNNVSLDGTLTVEGATQLNSTLTVGVDDTGHDVKFFGATSGSYMLWDESTDDLLLMGAARLGIGTSVPPVALSVHGSNGGFIALNREDTNTTIGENLGKITFGADDPSDGTFVTAAYVQALASGTWDSSDAGADLIFGTSLDGASSVTTKMIIQDDGKVGIGDTSPYSKLSISTSDNDNTGGLQIENSGGQSSFFWMDGSNILHIDNATGASRDIVFNSSGNGNVGIGTASPTSKFHISRTGDPNLEGLITATALTDTDYASWRVSGIGNSVTNIAEIGVIYENGSDTNAPTSFIRLEASDGAGNFLFVGDDNELKITTTKTDIGKVSGPTVVGDQTSDERLKNISSSPFPYGLSEVNAITPIKFTYKDAKVPVDKLGFGAQTMQSIIPESVQQTNDCLDGYDVSVDENGKETYIPKSSNNKMMMQYYQLIPVMVKAIQELSAKVTALENA